MNNIYKRIITRLRISFFPTEHDKEIKRWFAHGNDEKFRYDYELDGDSLVLDLGGYKGQWASDIYARYNCRVLVFEPVKLFAEQIEKRFQKNPMIEVFCLALGANKREEIISLSEDGSSLYRNAPLKEIIQFHDVAKFLDDHNIKNIDLIKINIEGGEYELLPRLLEMGCIEKIRNLQIQFHDLGPDSERQMINICSELAKTHVPTYQYKFVWENWVLRDVSTSQLRS